MIAASSGNPALAVLSWLILIAIIWFIVARRRNRRKAVQDQAFQLGRNLATRDPTPVSTSSGDSGEQTKLDALAKLADLRSKGILSEDEFAAQKKKILET
jgi:flagellar biosynthesis/type III secretory pathway M-ring protein FliF/YscJ